MSSRERPATSRRPSGPSTGSCASAVYRTTPSCSTGTSNGSAARARSRTPHRRSREGDSDRLPGRRDVPRSAINILESLPRWPGLGGRAGRGPGRPGAGPMACRAWQNAWQEDRRRPVSANARYYVCAGQPHNANDDHQQPLTVPRFPGTTDHLCCAGHCRYRGSQSAHGPQPHGGSRWRPASGAVAIDQMGLNPQRSASARYGRI